MIVKIPATRAGIAAIEEATAHGISINATVSFTLPQCIAVAEAVERGLQRREADGHDISRMGPVCTIMVGRLDDWLKVVMESEGITTDPGHLEWAGVAVFKKAYRLFRERGYRTAAAVRGVSQSHALERVDRRRRRDLAAVGVAEALRRERHRGRVADRHARGAAHRRRSLSPVRRLPARLRRGRPRVDEFDDFAPTRRTLRQFLAACDDLSQLVRDVMIPNPRHTMICTDSR